MELCRAEAIARALMATHLPGEQLWCFGWIRKTRVCGECWYGSRKIVLSKPIVLENEEIEIRNTILHEIAHALAGPHAGHGPMWKLQAIALGARPEACTRTMKLPAGQYVAVCPNCGAQHYA